MIFYLASPYSSPDPAVRDQRFRDACRATAALVRQGIVVFAPIVHSHPLVEHGLPTTWSYWSEIDRRFLEVCDELVVLMLDGWQESRGVQEEIQIARELGKPIHYVGVGDGSPRVSEFAAEAHR